MYENINHVSIAYLLFDNKNEGNVKRWYFSHLTLWQTRNVLCAKLIRVHLDSKSSWWSKPPKIKCLNSSSMYLNKTFKASQLYGRNNGYWMCNRDEVIVLRLSNNRVCPLQQLDLYHTWVSNIYNNL